MYTYVLRILFSGRIKRRIGPRESHHEILEVSFDTWLWCKVEETGTPATAEVLRSDVGHRLTVLRTVSPPLTLCIFQQRQRGTNAYTTTRPYLAFYDNASDNHKFDATFRLSAILPFEDDSFLKIIESISTYKISSQSNILPF